MMWRVHIDTGSVLLLLFGGLLSAKSQPLPSLDTNTFDYSVSYRQSVCDRQDLLHNRTVRLRDALSGLDIHTLMANDSNFVLLNSQGAIDLGTRGGLVPVIMDELARRGRFRWRNSYGFLESIALPANKTYGELLSWSVDTFDVSAARWAKTLERIDLGASFPEGWNDGTLIMVGVEAESSSSLDVWAFLEPFSAGVWAMIAVTLVVSGLAYMWLDWYDEKSDARLLGNEPTQNIWLAALSFTGQFEYHPSTDAARLFTFSLAFFALLITSAYTANLASFLVVQNTPAVVIQGVGDAFKNGYVFCVWRGSADEEIMFKAFPEAKVKLVETEVELYQGVRDGVQNGGCDVGITSKSSWDEASQNKDINAGCKLTWVGRAFIPREGSFTTRSDSGTLCTSLVRDVLNLHMVEMKNDGFLGRAWDAHLAKFGSLDCDTVSEPQDEDTMQLTLQAMGGTFIVHYSLTALAILVAVLCKWMRRRKQNEAASKPQTGAPMTNRRSSQESEQYKSGVDDSGDGMSYGEMLRKQDDKMSEILAMIKELQGESNAMREKMLKDDSSLSQSPRSPSFSDIRY